MTRKFWTGQWENQIEAFYDYDDEIRVIVVYVDVRGKENRKGRIEPLVKGCRPQHRIDVCGTVRITKPIVFREMDEGHLIGDALEAKQEREVVETQTAMRSKKERLDRMSETMSQMLLHELSKSLPGASIKIKNRHSSYREVVTDTFTGGMNGWIYCTSIAPETDDEEKALWRGWGKGYTDCFPISDRRQFARAMAGMAIRQLGARSGNSWFKNESDGVAEEEIWKKSQLIVHGPVEYRDDPYGTTEQLGTFERAISAIFIKRRKYETQREYRFLVHTDEEPGANEDSVILKASPEMLGAIMGS